MVDVLPKETIHEQKLRDVEKSDVYSQIQILSAFLSFYFFRLFSLGFLRP